MVITKVSLKPGETEVSWKTSNDNRTAVHSITDHEPPEPEFGEAMAALIPDVAEVLELPKKYMEGVRVTTLSLTTKEDDTLGGVITAERPVDAANAPFVMHTPHIKAFDGTLLERVADVINAAERFISGKRAQGELFDDDGSSAEIEGDVEPPRTPAEKE